MVAGSRLEELADEEIMSGCRAASAEEIRRRVGVLAGRHFAGLMNFIASMTRDRAGAEDIVQETFVRVYRKATEYRCEARFTTWLYRIGRNLALNEIRNRRRRPRLVLDRSLSAESPGSDLGSVLPAPGAGPDDEAATRDRAAVVRQAVADLPENLRWVVVVCDMERKSYAECAEILELKIGTVRSRLHRARARLGELLRSRITP